MGTYSNYRSGKTRTGRYILLSVAGHLALFLGVSGSGLPGMGQGLGSADKLLSMLSHRGQTGFPVGMHRAQAEVPNSSVENPSVEVRVVSSASATQNKNKNKKATSKPPEQSEAAKGKINKISPVSKKPIRQAHSKAQEVAQLATDSSELPAQVSRPQVSLEPTVPVSQSLSESDMVVVSDDPLSVRPLAERDDWIDRSDNETASASPNSTKTTQNEARLLTPSSSDLFDRLNQEINDAGEMMKIDQPEANQDFALDIEDSEGILGTKPVLSSAGRVSEQRAGNQGFGNSGPARVGLAQMQQRPGNPLPEYSLEDRYERREGLIRVLADVDNQGRVRSLEIIESTGHPSLDQRTLASLRQWRFSPGQEARVEIPFRWSLRGEVQPIPRRLRRDVSRN